MKTASMPPNPCPRCGQPLPGGGLGRLCPSCLLAQGAKNEAENGFKPPALEDLGRWFPQLELLGLLGAGGMGAVYKARQPGLDRVVALKIVPTAGVGWAHFAERFNREARALARLSHPHIVSVHEFGQTGEYHYFIMEFVDGSNLRQLESAGRLSPREALQLIPQICDALQYAHDQGVVHRDIKPENVLVDRNGRVKIADFGLAKILGHNTGSSRLTVEGQVMGTPHYMAPEQMERPLAVDHRADIYSLGVVIYEMLTGDLPLGKFSPPSRKVQVDVRLDEVVLRALENDPACRYQRASEVKSKVEIIATGSGDPPAAPAPEPSQPRVVRWQGFSFVIECGGKRCLDWREIVRAWAILFGLLTLALGVVSAVAGRSLGGWLGIIGWMSLVPRAGAAALLVGWGAWRSWSRPWEEPIPYSSDGTRILCPSVPWWRGRRWVLFLVFLFATSWTLRQQPEWVAGARNALGIPRVSVTQAAQRDLNAGSLVARFSGGERVELLAVGSGVSGSNAWWNPANGRIPSHRYEVRPAVALPGGDPAPAYLVFRSAGFLPEAGEAHYQADPSANCSSGGEVRQDGILLRAAWPVAVGWPETTERGNLKLGFGLQPWRSVVVHRPSGGSTSVHRRRGDLPWSASLNHLGNESGGLAVTMVIHPQNPEWETRVVAVDAQGKLHTHHHASGNPGSGGATWTYVFSEVSKEQVEEIRFQVRPVEWAEFRDLPLKASAATGF